MVSTINPMVHGIRRTRLPTLLLMHTIGAFAGGLCAGWIFGHVGGVLQMAGVTVAPSTVAVIVGVVGVAYALREAELLDVPAPQSPWQVPVSWLTYGRPRVVAALFGIGLGAGILTRMTSSLYPVVVWAVLSGRPAQCAVVMGCFGVARTLPLWTIDVRCPTPAQRALCERVLHDWHAAARMLNAVALAFIGGILMVGAWL